MSSLRILVVLALVTTAAACGSSGSSQPTSPSPTPSPAPAGGPATSISIPVGAETLGNRAFVPANLNIDTGTTVTWTNSDRESHTSTSDVAGWNSGTISPGRQFSFTFQTAGTFAYHCAIHPGMTGTVVVR
jgi:plastocyanin